jgi:RNA polymerase sigma-70 factor, ECF subfamily
VTGADHGAVASGSADPWIARLRAGDPEALERLARQEAPRVARLLGSLLGPRQDMEDLVQVVFLEACRALPGFRGDSAVSTFIGGITVRVARRALRPSAWLRRRVWDAPEPVAASDPERGAQEAEQLRHVRRALEAIAVKKRVAFLLWAVDGLDVAAIAELTGASVAATKSRIYYAQRELQQRAARDPALRDLLTSNRGTAPAHRGGASGGGRDGAR